MIADGLTRLRLSIPTTSLMTTATEPAPGHAARSLPRRHHLWHQQRAGFDYLRDNMVVDLDQCSQRELAYAIWTRLTAFIDEARTPLIISGPAEESSDLYRRFCLRRACALTRTS